MADNFGFAQLEKFVLRVKVCAKQLVQLRQTIDSFGEASQSTFEGLLVEVDGYRIDVVHRADDITDDLFVLL